MKVYSLIFFLSVRMYVCDGNSINRVKYCLYNCQKNTLFTVKAFFKEISTDGSLHVPEDCQHYLILWPLCPELFSTEEPV